MDDGTVTQFGPTAEIYRSPANLSAARVFSDPPINTAEVRVAGREVTMGAAKWRLEAETDLSDGLYTVAIRPHRVKPTKTAAAEIALEGQVLVTEISGSDSSAHFRLGAQDWVSLAAGVHPYEVGESHTFYMDPSHCRYFAADGARVA